jgi:hypothetical protein
MLGWGDAWPPANSKRNQWRDDARARAAREGVWADWRLAASFPNRSLVLSLNITIHPFFFFLVQNLYTLLLNTGGVYDYTYNMYLEETGARSVSHYVLVLASCYRRNVPAASRVLV